MSYSRWSTSRWYTWADLSGRFAVDDLSDREFYTLEECRKLTADAIVARFNQVEPDEAAELLGYVSEYIRDCASDPSLARPQGDGE